MIPRDEWEEAAKDIRMKFLSRANDPQIRLMTAGIMDAVLDEMYEALALREFVGKFK